MKRMSVLLIVVVVLSMIGILQAEEQTSQTQGQAVQLEKESKLDFTFDLTYMSKWITRGKEGYGSSGAMFETLSMDLWDTGFGIAVGHQNATSSGYVNKQRFNYRVYYGGSFFDDQAFKTNCKLSWTYKNYYRVARDTGNSQEWKLKLSWPEILSVENLSPYYSFSYEYPAGSGYGNSNKTGWVHRFGLAYKLKTAELPSPINLSASIAYWDGLGGPSYDHDWSDVTFGASTKFKIHENLTLVPSVYYQISMEDSVNKDDELYCKVSLKYKF